MSLFSRGGREGGFFPSSQTPAAPAPNHAPVQAPPAGGSQQQPGNITGQGNVPGQGQQPPASTGPTIVDPFSLQPKQATGLTPEQLEAQQTKRAAGIKQYVESQPINTSLTPEQTERLNSGDSSVWGEVMHSVGQQVLTHAVAAAINYSEAKIAEAVKTAVSQSVLENRSITKIEEAVSSIQEKFSSLASPEYAALISKTIHQYRQSGKTMAEAEQMAEDYFAGMFPRTGGQARPGSSYRGGQDIGTPENPNGEGFDWNKFANV